MSRTYFCFLLAIVILVSLTNSCGFSTDISNIDTELSKFPEISHSELVNVIKEKSAFIIDANGNESYKRGHIPGAVDFSIEKEELITLLPKDKEKLIVCYCGSPMCPAWYKAATFLTEKGYTNVKHYKDGLKGWIKSGEIIEEGTG